MNRVRDKDKVRATDLTLCQRLWVECAFLHCARNIRQDYGWIVLTTLRTLKI